MSTKGTYTHLPSDGKTLAAIKYAQGLSSLGPVSDRVSYVLVVEGYEHMQFLAMIFPIPTQGVNEGEVVFMETKNFHAYDFLRRVDGVQLNAQIQSPEGIPVFHLSGVTFSGGWHSSVRWDARSENDNLEPMTAVATMSWDQAMCVADATVGVPQ